MKTNLCTNWQSSSDVHYLLKAPLWEVYHTLTNSRGVSLIFLRVNWAWVDLGGRLHFPVESHGDEEGRDACMLAFFLLDWCLGMLHIRIGNLILISWRTGSRCGNSGKTWMASEALSTGLHFCRQKIRANPWKGEGAVCPVIYFLWLPSTFLPPQ